MPDIQKSTMTFTFLHPAGAVVADMTVADVFEQCEEGDFIGDWSTPVETQDVPADQVRAELLALGNDGHFFETQFEDETEPDD